ncbi:fused MFS/spermidine synthase [Nocardioides panacisoli]|uniref:spermidine synthase n=1 Tax=Nocardioides panacisoli TaxID=627624 RepID=UPI001C633C19|nr:fused MFS/spermidine synthase [Nocardioides panacisoli]QYJ05584.1 fused MFS/spermidine synthase [Nocardioides panacisoli]
MTTPLDPPDGDATVREPLTLADGTPVELVARDGGWTLEVDGIRQSHVGPPGEPPALASVRWMLAGLGAAPATCAHLGGGLLTLPRALASMRPDSRQHVVELDPVLADVARRRFGLPPGVTLEVGDARAWLDTAAPAAWDALVVDVFSGGRIPPPFTSRECFAHARAALAEGGLLVLNSVAAPDLTFTRRQLAGLRSEFAHVAMVVQGSALHGLRFGNAVLLASATPLDAAAICAGLAGDPSKGALVTDLDAIVDGAVPATDADGLWSPVPDLPDVSGALRMLDATQRAVRDVVRRPED